MRIRCFLLCFSLTQKTLLGILTKRFINFVNDYSEMWGHRSVTGKGGVSFKGYLTKYEGYFISISLMYAILPIPLLKET